VRNTWGALLLAALGLWLAGCPSTTHTLTVRVQSGLRAGFEIRHVEARLYRGSVPCATDDAPLRSSGRALAPTDQGALADGALTATTFDALEPGLYTVRARFRRPPPSPDQSSDSGTVLVERCLVTSLSSDRVVRIALTSDCVNVECPAPAGSPAFDQCLNGRCVDPRCDPDDPTTADFCCDRALLGDACDTDPTLCRDASACEPTLACAGASRCEGGVCVEPEDDACGAATYCASETGTCLPEPTLDGLDAGARDGGVPGIGEICVLSGDEDGDGDADCADLECTSSRFCLLEGCAPITRGPPPGEPIPVPTHWFRGDLSPIVTPRGELCALVDLVGGIHLGSVVSVEDAASTIGGQPAIALAGPASLGLLSAETLVPWDGDHSLFLVTQSEDASNGGTPLVVTAPPPETDRTLQLRHSDGRVLLGLEASTWDVGPYTAGEPTLFALSLGPLVRDEPFELEAGTSADATATLVAGTGLADPPSRPGSTSVLVQGPADASTLRVAEILSYDRRLSAAERDQVEVYLANRYGID
jgi:hypothetical protein